MVALGGLVVQPAHHSADLNQDTPTVAGTLGHVLDVRQSFPDGGVGIVSGGRRCRCITCVVPVRSDAGSTICEICLDKKRRRRCGEAAR